MSFVIVITFAITIIIITVILNIICCSWLGQIESPMKHLRRSFRLKKLHILAVNCFGNKFRFGSLNGF